MVDLSRPLRGAPVAVFDIETTGSKDDDRICEVAVVVFERFFETDPVVAINTLVRPDPALDRPWQASFVHGIKAPHVARAPTWDEVWPDVAELLTEHVPCAYNASFDLRFLELERDNVCSTLAVPELEQCLDPLPIVRRIDTPPAGKGKGWHSLTEAAGRRNIAKGGHRAKGDALAAAKLLQKLVDEVYRRPELGAPQRPSVLEWLHWQRNPGKGDGSSAALPMQLVAPAVPLEQAAPAERREGHVRKLWAVARSQPGGSMWLTEGRGFLDGSYRWTISPGNARRFETEEEAAGLAGRVAQKEREEARRYRREPWPVDAHFLEHLARTGTP